MALESLFYNCSALITVSGLFPRIVVPGYSSRLFMKSITKNLFIFLGHPCKSVGNEFETPPKQPKTLKKPVLKASHHRAGPFTAYL